MATVWEVLEKTVQKHGNQNALVSRTSAGWQAMTWSQVSQSIQSIATKMLESDLKHLDRIAILSNNRKEWFLANIAAIASGGVPFGIYATCSPDQCFYILNHSAAKFVFVEDEQQLAKICSIKHKLPNLKKIIVFDPEAKFQGDDILSFTNFKSDSNDFSALKERISQQNENDLATLVYTSGTTAHPKAVMLSHKNLTWMADNFFKNYIPVSPEDSYLSYLPLSHIAEQLTSIHGPIQGGYQIYFAESMEKMPDNLKEVSPTLFLGVPRVWEKIESKLNEKISTAPKTKQLLLTASRYLANQKLLENNSSPLINVGYKIADKIILSKLKNALGFGRCRIFLTGAAPISPKTLAFFYSLGICISEAYGLSESTGPTSFNLYPNQFKLGSVGKPLKGSDLKIAEDGEILVKGPHVFLGYLDDKESTSASLTSNGWLRTGDLGKLAKDGFVHVTGRKKNLIITAGGENISTEMLEDHFKTIEGIEHVVAIGDQKKYITLLFTIELESAKKLSKKLGSLAQTRQQIAKCPIFNEHINSQIQEINKKLARVQTVKKFKILENPFEESSGELTPTLKVKRNIVLTKFQDTIEEMYA